MIAQTIVRFLLTFALIYGVYTETGIWTSLFALFVAVAIEFQNGNLKSMVDWVEEMEQKYKD